jgi:thiol-disulfide isomerase/thioredoxin
MSKLSGRSFLLGVTLLIVSAGVCAQTSAKVKGAVPKATDSLPVVTVIDQAGLERAVRPNGKPLLINFWATWCDPCRDEFPDLVKINSDYKNKIDFITISLDDLADLKLAVPKFLVEMKAGMPAYLLRVPDEGAAISSVYSDWTGGLPFTILFDKSGKIAYSRQGKIVPATLAGQLDRLLNVPAGAQ